MKKAILYFCLVASAFGQGSRPPVTTLDGLSDVTLTSPTNGQALLYETASSKWKNAAVPGGALSSLTDVTVASLVDNQFLQWDSASSRWVNYGPILFSDVSGNIAVSQMNGGLDAASNSYWRGDGVWAPIAAAGTIPGTTSILKGDGSGNAAATSPVLSMDTTGLAATGSNDGDFLLNWWNTGAGTSAATGLHLQVTDGYAQIKVMGSSNTGTGIVTPDDLWIRQHMAPSGPKKANIVLSTAGDQFLYSNDDGVTQRVMIGYGVSVGSGTDPGAGYLNVLNGYQVNGATQAQVYMNGAAPTGAGASFGTVNKEISGSVITLPAGTWKAGGTYHCAFDMSKTAAGTAGIVITVHMGTGGSTTDAAVATVTYIAGTAVADGGIFDVYVTFRSVGSGTSAVVVSSSRHTKVAAIGAGLSGFANATSTVSAGFNSTTQTKISLGFNGGASFSGSSTFTQTEYKQ